MKSKNIGLIKATCNYLIIIGIYVVASTIETQAGINNNTTFPFDTLLTIACPSGAGGIDSCPINISRYSTIIYFKCVGGFAMCPENDYCDFLLQKEPADSSSYLIQTPIDDYCQPHNSIHNRNIQYLVKNSSLTLFMAVDSVYGAVSTPNKIISVEFDTASFLSKTAIIPVSKNSKSLNKSEIIPSLKIQYFDILGRLLPANLIHENQGMVTDKLIITNNRQILFKNK